MAQSIGFRDYAFISLGSNLATAFGSSQQTLEWALDKLKNLSVSPVITSSVYISSPVGSPPDTPDFLNAVAGIIPLGQDTPLSLLHFLQALEDETGRTRSDIQNEARTLDLDLITFKNEILNSDELILPHPRAHERRFILEPLIEITSNNFKLPGFNSSIELQLSALSNQQAIKKI
jgi:2-amino-4-hydroxy-6-hydroxymethyldihydropteridine diphosphokinase